ncbi:hypothetical protein LEP1GSC100_0871 [Leptospira interrogans serovar Bataviae str. UI 08561]|nr:hypothetical protein LEP1GSC100_0871 [Leptospira interrogans serovar Bataviae str. UI 08561]
MNSIWEATQEGSLCVPVKQEWEKILKIKLLRSCRRSV